MDCLWSKTSTSCSLLMASVSALEGNKSLLHLSRQSENIDPQSPDCTKHKNQYSGAAEWTRRIEGFTTDDKECGTSRTSLHIALKSFTKGKSRMKSKATQSGTDDQALCYGDFPTLDPWRLWTIAGVEAMFRPRWHG